MASVRIPAALAVLWTCAAAEAGESVSPFALRPGEVEGSLGPGGRAVLPLSFEIAPGHHLYRDQFSFSAAEGSDVRVAGAEFPEPKRKKDEFLGRTVEVYEKQAEIRLAVELPAEFSGRQANARISVRFQGCSEETCFLPDTRAIELTVPVEAGPPREATAPRAKVSGWLARGWLLNLLCFTCCH